MKKIQKFYIGAVLDKKSKKSLKEKIPPLYVKERYHHMTIAYMPKNEIFNKYKKYIGKNIKLNINGYCFDNKIQAAMVKTKLSENNIPHITLSCKKNVDPVYSNTMLKNKSNYKKINLKLSGKIEILKF